MYLQAVFGIQGKCKTDLVEVYLVDLLSPFFYLVLIFTDTHFELSQIIVD